MRRVAIILPTLAALPGPLMAEGAQMVLDCTFATACTETGDCGPGEGPARFVLAPEDVDDTGAGRYSVRLDDAEAIEAQRLCRTGPFVWSLGSDTQTTLVLTGPASALLVRQVTDTGTNAPPGAEIDIMNCEMTL
jgi:hypothetical protein